MSFKLLNKVKYLNGFLFVLCLSDLKSFSFLDFVILITSKSTKGIRSKSIIDKPKSMLTYKILLKNCTRCLRSKI